MVQDNYYTEGMQDMQGMEDKEGKEHMVWEMEEEMVFTFRSRIGYGTNGQWHKITTIIITSTAFWLTFIIINIFSTTIFIAFIWYATTCTTIHVLFVVYIITRVLYRANECTYYPKYTLHHHMVLYI